MPIKFFCFLKAFSRRKIVKLEIKNRIPNSLSYTISLFSRPSLSLSLSFSPLSLSVTAVVLPSRRKRARSRRRLASCPTARHHKVCPCLFSSCGLWCHEVLHGSAFRGVPAAVSGGRLCCEVRPSGGLQLLHPSGSSSSLSVFAFFFCCFFSSFFCLGRGA